MYPNIKSYVESNLCQQACQEIKLEMFGSMPDSALTEVTSVSVQLNFQITRGGVLGKHRSLGDMDTLDSFFALTSSF